MKQADSCESFHYNLDRVKELSSLAECLSWEIPELLFFDHL